MIRIKGRKISITRGDCRPFTITFTGSDVPADGTDVLFTVKKNRDFRNPVIEKRLKIAESKVEVLLTNDDTKELQFGDYEWDIRFPDLFGEDEPFTPMEPAQFEIVKVIGNVGYTDQP